MGDRDQGVANTHQWEGERGRGRGMGRWGELQCHVAHFEIVSPPSPSTSHTSVLSLSSLVPLPDGVAAMISISRPTAQKYWEDRIACSRHAPARATVYQIVKLRDKEEKKRKDGMRIMGIKTLREDGKWARRRHRTYQMASELVIDIAPPGLPMKEKPRGLRLAQIPYDAIPATWARYHLPFCVGPRSHVARRPPINHAGHTCILGSPLMIWRILLSHFTIHTSRQLHPLFTWFYSTNTTNTTNTKVGNGTGIKWL